MQVFSQSKVAISDTIGTDTIVINIDSGAYYSLTPLGAQAWANALAGSPLQQDELAAARTLCAEGLLQSETGCAADLDPNLVFEKYTDMESLLIADPIHEVDEQGWPKLK